MKYLGLLLSCLLSCVVFAQQAYNITSPYDPATVPMSEEKRGEVIKFLMTESSQYPGTEREILVYIPQQYRDTAPACLLVCMDGILYDATTVLDNLISSGEMPVTIGIFINPGVVYDEDRNVVRYNRCKEFDSTDDTFAQFIEQEVLPKVRSLKTKDGQSINISSDPNDCAITGASSGGIAAFTAAWNRPDMFSRVYTTVGTFVAMRGGHEYPAIVRKTEPSHCVFTCKMVGMMFGILFSENGLSIISLWNQRLILQVMKRFIIGIEAIIASSMVPWISQMPCAGYGKVIPQKCAKVLPIMACYKRS